MKKRHLDRINSWYNKYKEPPVKAIEGKRDHYAGLWIRPWYGLKKKNPTLEVFQVMLDRMSQLYDDWDKTFRESGIPYDLQLWIYDEFMIESQLVCAGVDHAGDRRTNYFTACPEQYKFQTEKYKKGDIFNPADFEWITYEVRDYLFEKTDELNKKQIEKMLTQDWHEEMHKPGTDEEERCFWRIHDFVWVGRKK